MAGLDVSAAATGWRTRVDSATALAPTHGSHMRVLFVHQNFPGQFKFLAPALVAAGHEVMATTLQKNVPASWQGVRLETYGTTRGSTPNVHPWVVDFETKVIRGEGSSARRCSCAMRVTRRMR